MDNEIKIDDVLAKLREMIGTQAQEIAILHATISAMKKTES